MPRLHARRGLRDHPVSLHPWPHRVERVLAALTTEWQSFEVVHARGALDAKQMTGALVWLRNRRRVQSRMTPAGLMQWRKS